jgi:hypothetical protein
MHVKSIGRKLETGVKKKPTHRTDNEPRGAMNAGVPAKGPRGGVIAIRFFPASAHGVVASANFRCVPARVVIVCCAIQVEIVEVGILHGVVARDQVVIIAVMRLRSRAWIFLRRGFNRVRRFGRGRRQRRRSRCRRRRKPRSHSAKHTEDRYRGECRKQRVPASPRGGSALLLIAQHGRGTPRLRDETKLTNVADLRKSFYETSGIFYYIGIFWKIGVRSR